ncbi:sugar phosphate isomerase/epimerase family protein [Niallia sp. 03133]|uniref:sugar phosphate isomerase/epimerase family protein n=1 Tax=Niallia sp. 03133 TaxID=3458060 RepID=UPI0040448E8A
MKKIPIAVQMYSLRKECEQDFAGTLTKVADIGFDGVELAGYGGSTSKKVSVLLKDLGLQAAASHVPLDELQSKLPQVIEDQHILGSRYVVCPYLLPEHQQEKDYKELISFLNIAGEQCKKEGITLCYHNHDFELTALSDGRKALETIFDSTNESNVQAELDVYWLAKAGENPVAWLNRYQKRTPLVHLKDMTTDEEQFFAELGTGGVDIEAIVNAGEDADVQWWIVEQDESRRTPFESIEISMNYLKKKLKI